MKEGPRNFMFTSSRYNRIRKAYVATWGRICENTHNYAATIALDTPEAALVAAVEAAAAPEVRHCTYSLYHRLQPVSFSLLVSHVRLLDAPETSEFLSRVSVSPK